MINSAVHNLLGAKAINNMLLRARRAGIAVSVLIHTGCTLLAMYRRYHKSTQPGGNSSSKMLGRLRQTVGREIRRRSTGGLVESVDKAEDIYAEKLRRAREDTAAVQDGTATEDQTRRVLLMRQTKQGYADLARYYESQLSHSREGSASKDGEKLEIKISTNFLL